MDDSYIYNLGTAYYEVARRHADRTALRYAGGKEYNHAFLNRYSNQIARILLGRGVERGDVVAIISNKSVHAIASMLACLKIGAIYTNLDVTSPSERIEKMLATCAPKLIVSDQVRPDLELSTYSDRLYILNDPKMKGEVHAASSENLGRTNKITGGDAAYIMFTSGSTGFPKGAVMSHSNVLNFIKWGRETFQITSKDVFTNVNPLYFDNSVFDFYVSLFNGATLCPIGSEVVRKGKELISIVNELKCTIWFSVPSMLVYLLTLKAINRTDLGRCRKIIFGGEGFPKPKLRELHELVGARIELVNVYGPTECTCICSSYVIREEEFENLHELAPLGEIAPNFGYFIKPMTSESPGVGELFLYGPNVGLGYFNDAERTRRSFVQDPTGVGFRRIMYRTGDLVSESSNGLLHFKGRVDNQIKHMGYRIELEEIEAAFSTLGYVDEVGVIYERQNDVSGNIFAYVGTRAEHSEKKTIEEIRRILPPYMVPRRIYFMLELPKNQNGKIDRKKLRELKL